MNLQEHIARVLDFQSLHPHTDYHFYVLRELVGNGLALKALSEALRISLMCGHSKFSEEIGAIAIPKQKFGRTLYIDESCEARPNSFKVYSSVDTVYADRVSAIVNGFIAGFNANNS